MRDCCNKYSIYEISVNKGKSGVVNQETQKGRFNTMGRGPKIVYERFEIGL